MGTTIILKSKSKAVQLAKETLRNNCGVKRIVYSTIKNTSCKCACGETEAIELTAKIKGEWCYMTVGICKACGYNN